MNPAVLLPFLANRATNTTSNDLLPDVVLNAIPAVPSSNLSDLSPRGCFIPDPTISQPPIIYADCHNIIRDQMATYPDMEKALIWSRQRSATTDVAVPYVRYYGSCALVLNVKREDEYELDSFADVVMSAIRLAKDCVIQPPHRGGQVDLGSRRRLQLTIIRRPEDPVEEAGSAQRNGSGVLAVGGENTDESHVNTT